MHGQGGRWTVVLHMHCLNRCNPGIPGEFPYLDLVFGIKMCVGSCSWKHIYRI